MIPSPPHSIACTPSQRTDRCTILATAPLVIAISFRQISRYRIYLSRRTVTSSIILRSILYSPVAICFSLSISLLSNSAIKPIVPILTPRIGMEFLVAAFAMCKIVPSPPKQITKSAFGSSRSSLSKTKSFGRSKVLSTSNGKHSFVSIPQSSRIFTALRTVWKFLSRYGLGVSMTLFTIFTPSSSDVPAEPQEPYPAQWLPCHPRSDDREIRYFPQVPLQGRR